MSTVISDAIQLALTLTDTSNVAVVSLTNLIYSSGVLDLRGTYDASTIVNLTASTGYKVRVFQSNNSTTTAASSTGMATSLSIVKLPF